MRSADSSNKPKPTTSSVRPRLSGPYIEVLLLFLLVLTVFVVSWPGMSAPRILDDVDQLKYIGQFDSWKACFTSNCFDLFRPFRNLTF